MILEIAEIACKPGEEAAFEQAVAQAAAAFKTARGCRGMELQRSIENPGQYRLVVQWETVEDHTVHFRNSGDFARWRALAAPHFAGPPKVEHVELAVHGFGASVLAAGQTPQDA